MPSLVLKNIDPERPTKRARGLFRRERKRKGYRLSSFEIESQDRVSLVLRRRRSPKLQLALRGWVPAAKPVSPQARAQGRTARRGTLDAGCEVKPKGKPSSIELRGHPLSAPLPPRVKPPIALCPADGIPFEPKARPTRI